jgi:hypothetical protein
LFGTCAADPPANVRAAAMPTRIERLALLGAAATASWHICSVAYPVLQAAGQLEAYRGAKNDLAANAAPANQSMPR